MSTTLEPVHGTSEAVAVEPMVVDDPGRHTFRVHRFAMTSADVHRAEIERIFGSRGSTSATNRRSWEPGDFLAAGGGRPIFMVRGENRNVNVFLNTCPHRGAMVCREKHGNEKMFRCFYLTWAFDLQGSSSIVPGNERLRRGLNVDGLRHNLVPRSSINTAALYSSTTTVTRSISRPISPVRRSFSIW